MFKIFEYNFINDPLIYEIPQSTRKYLTKYAINKSKTFIVKQKEDFVFICRFYYLTKKYIKNHGYPADSRYELGDVFLFDKWRGKKLSTKFLNQILQQMPYKIVLWTTTDNIPAIKLYTRLNFSIFNNPIGQKWIKEIYSNENKWVLKYKIQFMYRS